MLWVEVSDDSGDPESPVPALRHWVWLIMAVAALGLAYHIDCSLT